MIKNYINRRCYCIDVIVIKSNKKDFCYNTLIKANLCQLQYRCINDLFISCK